MSTFALPVQSVWFAEQTDDKIDLRELVGSTPKLQISANIQSLYSYVEWRVRLDPLMIENGVFAVGKKVAFTFSDTDIRTFSVLRVKGLPTNQTMSLADEYEIVLVSPWYFEQIIGSKAYRGSVSSILTEITTPFSFTGGKIVAGLDVENKRYRTQQTEGSFIEKRLKDYYGGEDRSLSFIYVDDSHRFYATNEKAILGSVEKNYAIALEHPNLSVFSDVLNDDKKIQRLFKLRVSQFSYNLNDALWPSSNAAISYTTSLKGQLKEYQAEPFIGTLKAKQFLPITQTKSVSVARATEIYVDDSCQNYSDVLTQGQNLVMKKLLEGQGWILAGDLNLNLAVGQPIDLYVENTRAPEDDSLRSLFAQTLIITSTDHKFQGLQGQTVISCSLPSFSYSDPLTVAQYFKSP
jgi:hypothetical protein